MDSLTVVALVSGILASLEVLCKAGHSTYLYIKKNKSRRVQIAKKVSLRRPIVKKAAGARPMPCFLAGSYRKATNISPFKEYDVDIVFASHHSRTPFLKTSLS
jgi:hypothetical protein